jgi:putative endonuclease
VLYTGVTNDLLRRSTEHKLGKDEGFTNRYNIHKLVYFEEFRSIELAIEREKKIKKYSRLKKIALIEKFNRNWTDLNKNDRIIWQPEVKGE